MTTPLPPTQTEIDALRTALVRAIDSLPYPNPSTLPLSTERYKLPLSQLGTLEGLIEKGVKSGRTGVVRPKRGVEEGREWIVGVLLRTKQIIQVEEKQKELMNALTSSPSPSTSVDDASGTTWEQRKYFVQEGIRNLERLKDDEGWDWKGRVDVDPDSDEGEEHDDDYLETKEGAAENKEAPSQEPKWTLQDVIRYQKTGIKPS